VIHFYIPSWVIDIVDLYILDAWMHGCMEGQMERFGSQGLVSARNLSPCKEIVLAYAIRERRISFT